MTVQRGSSVPIMSVLLTAFLFFIPIDMLNSIIFRQTAISVSAPFKIMVAGCIIAYLAINHRRYLAILAIPFVLGFALVHAMIGVDYRESITGTAMIFRFTLIAIFYLFFLHVAAIRGVDRLFLIAKMSFVFLALNIVIGAMGFGEGMYSSSSGVAIGTRGLIFAGNELGVAVLTAGSILTIEALTQSRFTKFTLVSFLVVLMAAFMTTKVALVGATVLLVFLPLIGIWSLVGRFRIRFRALYLLLFLVFAAPIALSFAFYFSLFQQNLWERIAHNYAGNDIVSFALSSRNKLVFEALDLFSEYGVLEMLFGTSLSWTRQMKSSKIVEIDPIDFLLTYGIIGLVFVAGFWAYLLARILAARNANPYARHAFFVFLLLTCIASTAGHVLNSGTSGFLIALLAAIGSSQAAPVSIKNSSHKRVWPQLGRAAASALPRSLS